MQTSNLSKDTSWDLIFKLYDMQLYLSRLELNEISLASKQILSELKPSIFGSIYINNSNVNHIIKQIDARKPSSNLNFIRTLRIESILQDSFSSIFNSLSNISSLTLGNQQLNLTFINSIFSNLSQLNSLKLSKVNIEFNLSIENSNELKIPLTVRKLSLSNCTSLIYNDKASGVGSREAQPVNDSNCAYNTIQNLKFHSLQQLSIKSAIKHNSQPSDNPLFNNYFVNNPNLTSFSVEMCKLNEESVTLILNLKSLTHLKLIGRNCTFEKVPIFLGSNHSLKSLHLDYTIASYHTDFILEFVKHCNNIGQLTVDYSEFIASKIDQIVAGLPTLNKLTIIRAGCMQSFNLNLTNSSIKRLCFVNFSLFRIDFNRFENLNRLRVINLINFNQIGGLDKKGFSRKYNEYGWLTNFQGNNISLSKLYDKLAHKNSEENFSLQA